MKFYSAIAALLFCAQVSFSQIAVRILNYRPTGDFGFVMKPLVSAELSYQPRFEDRWRWGLSFTYLDMKPRLDTFPIVTLKFDGGTTTVLPGVQSFQKYAISQLAAGGDFSFLHSKKFDFFAGLDFIIGVTNVQYTSNTLVVDETYSGGGVILGARGRVGFEYLLSDLFSVFVAATREKLFVSEPQTFLSGNDYGLGARFTFQ